MKKTRTSDHSPKGNAIAFLKAAVAYYYASLAAVAARIMTDNGCCYRSKAFRKACSDLGLKHQNQTIRVHDQPQGRALHPNPLREWPYAQGYPTSGRRAQELPIWLNCYS